MKLLAAVVFSALVGGWATLAAQPEDATSEIKPLMEKVNVAWMTLDPSKAAPYYAKDADVAFFDVAPVKYTGWKEYEHGAQKVIADWKSLKVALAPDFKTYKSGNVGWATNTMSMEIENPLRSRPPPGDRRLRKARGPVGDRA